VTAAIMIHDLCMPFEAANAAKYVHVFFRECLRFHWRRNTSDGKVRDASNSAYLCAWVSVCARRVFERLEAFHVDDADDVDEWNSDCLLPLTTGPNPRCDMVFPGHTSIIDDDTAPYATAACATCRGVHRVALAPGQRPDPNPKSKEKKAKKAAYEPAAAASTRKRKPSSKAPSKKRAKPSDDERSGEADESSATASRLPLPPPPPPQPTAELTLPDDSMHTTAADREEGSAVDEFPSLSSGFMNSSMFMDADDAYDAHRMFEHMEAVKPIVPASHQALSLPPIGFPLPAAVPVPAPLSSAQLGAMASVTGHAAPQRSFRIILDGEDC
jgi:hypothetical protein